MRIRRRKKKNMYIFLVLFALILLMLFFFVYERKTDVNKGAGDTKQISYGKYVKTIKDTYLYDDKGNKVGIVGKGVEISLNDGKSLLKKKYLKVADFDNKYYIDYKYLNSIKELSVVDDRYKNYIVFNENIITNDKTSFYDEDGNLVYQFNESYDLPIIIKTDDKYGVEYNNRLLYVKKDDVKDLRENYNTDQRNSSGIGVLNYHAFYDENNEEEKSNCVSDICHSKSQFKTHLDYFKDNDILTLKMKEVEMYIDGKLQLPKSVLITIDDGDRTKIAVDMLTEYKMYATIFLITSWYDPSEYYKTDYIELHSHGDNLHNTGVCPTGQGGGIQCLSEDEIQKDLKTTREKLDNTTYFCYPFYEYNEYSIRMLKEAGFTMAFIGESSKSDNLVHVDSDKFRLRRFVIVTYTTLDDFNEYFGQIS